MCGCLSGHKCRFPSESIWQLRGILVMTSNDLPTTYAGLMAWHPPRPIRDDAALDKAHVVVDALAGHDLNADQADYLEMLTTLVGVYEDEHHPVDTSGLSVADLLAEFCERHGLSVLDLGCIVGDAGAGPALLSGKREPSKVEAGRLADRFGVPPAVFMFPTRA